MHSNTDKSNGHSGRDDISMQARGFLEKSLGNVSPPPPPPLHQHGVNNNNNNNNSGTQEQQEQQSSSRRRFSKWDEPAPGVATNDIASVSDQDRLQKALEAARSIEQSLSLSAPPGDSTEVPHHLPQPPYDSQLPETEQEFEWTPHGIDPALISVPAPTAADHMPYMREIEINNLRNLNILTKASTLKEIERETGASLTTRGRFYDMRRGEMPPVGSMGPDEQPLTLFIAAETPQSLDQAMVKTGEIINMQQQKSFLIEKVYVGIDNPVVGFNVPANVIGPRGAYVKHISNTCNGTRVQLKGRGSAQRGMEDEDPEEPMYLHISGVHKNQMERARKLAESLVAKVKRDYAQFVERRKSQQQQFAQQPAFPAPAGPGMGAMPPYHPPYPGAPPMAPYGYPPPMQQGYMPYGGMPAYPPQYPQPLQSQTSTDPAPPGLESETPQAPPAATATAAQMADYYNQYHAYYSQYYGGAAPLPHQQPPAPTSSSSPQSQQSTPSQQKRDREESEGDQAEISDLGSEQKRQKVEQSPSQE